MLLDTSLDLHVYSYTIVWLIKYESYWETYILNRIQKLENKRKQMARILMLLSLSRSVSGTLFWYVYRYNMLFQVGAVTNYGGRIHDDFHNLYVQDNVSKYANINIYAE